MRKLPLIVFAILAITAIFLTIKNKNAPFSQISPSPSATASVLDLIQVEAPIPNGSVKNHLIVTGKARGSWYFEASFPIYIYDADGLELGITKAQAHPPVRGDWMTEDFVPFMADLEFKKPTTPTGTLVLKKDNASGLPEHDVELRVPVNFDLAHWTEITITSNSCKVTGCSSQICAEEETTTTCEMKPEYACYKNAKCERQEDGKCGWTPSDKLLACIYSAIGAPPQ